MEVKKEQETYNIGFTAGAAMLNEMRAVAEAYLDCGGNWEKTKDKTFKENLMEKDKMSSNVRYFALMKQRLDVLNNFEYQKTFFVFPLFLKFCSQNIKKKRQVAVLCLMIILLLNSC